jgi:hypothetical protein
MHEYEDRFDNIEVMLGRMIIENDKGMRRIQHIEKSLAELTALVSRNEQRADMDRQRAELDRQRAELDRQRSDQDRKNWNKKWGELSNKLGTIVEDIVAPNIPRIAKELFGCEEVDDLMVRRYVRNKENPALRREFDVIAVCGDKVLINETKSTVRIDYINSFIETLPQIFDYFPEYSDKVIVPVFSSLGIAPDMVNYLTKNRIYALAMGDENMELLNKAEVEKQAP